jgi:predicted NAD-dependent protein-ADP-ribosyltransferase YbiA (DUF1768 family)
MRPAGYFPAIVFIVTLPGFARIQHAPADSGCVRLSLAAPDSAFGTSLPRGLVLRIDPDRDAHGKSVGWWLYVSDPRTPSKSAITQPPLPAHGPYPSQILAWSARSQYFPDERHFWVEKDSIEIIVRLAGYTTDADSSSAWFTSGILEVRWYKTVPKYPTHWWTPVSSEGAPDWEILPQEADPGEVVLSKRNELGLLSNFAATPFRFHGKQYASLEGFWQMMLYPENKKDPRSTFPGIRWSYTREQVAQLVSFEAKKAGELAEENMKTMGIDWVSFEGKRFEYRPREPGEHYQLIVAATWEKVRQNPGVKKVLLSTGDLVLRPDHHQEPNAPAAWRYFEILTEIRSRLQKEEH